jgi:hypothetical protein
MIYARQVEAFLEIDKAPTDLMVSALGSPEGGTRTEADCLSATDAGRL